MGAYHLHMPWHARPTLWTLLFALLLQLLAGSAWAWRGPQASDHTTPVQTAHCHDTVAPDPSRDSHHAAGPSHSASVQADSHHCCAVGLAATVQTPLQSLPQAPPVSQHGPWASLSLRPDLRPPI